ncbi:MULTISPECIES: PhoX family protein [unclassified Arsukibacterium]|uniref:PhoX family protein n=1 Tax=unclassified Arsukibacterium TaxID=2635278 RepID=UPI000C5CC48A|nr:MULTISPECIES: PhoX family phosphatase [unclassified Arsukibacterium]MAA93694.1 Tat pathway signal protein [Rheinheimera sp.]MBM33078.1 Tat pathway signal protein [Rheinheimera sp.]HAW93086.1 Tat pathway signal protein [Candidatus Azambacteria bacterium]|tara:strand:- start:46336 stop:48366 length:2031 start_codon:yes stop_codon:yes gene_type:complete
MTVSKNNQNAMSISIDNSGVDPQTNFSLNPTFAAIVDSRMARRNFIKGSMGAAMAAFLGGTLAGCSSSDDETTPVAPTVPPVTTAPLLGFAAIATQRADTITVPEGYTARTFLPWGTPLSGSYPTYLADGSNSGSDQEQQVGMHHDGMHFFPIDSRTSATSSEEGLLVFNHEYIDNNLIHPNGITTVPRLADEVRKEVAAHGVSVAHIQKQADGSWALVNNSPFNRRITGATPMELAGPVRGSAKVITKYSPEGHRTRGTLNNCGNGYTPWGTYLTCEENWAGYFVNKDAEQPREQRRYGVPASNGRYLWETATPAADQYQRFNASTLADDASGDYRNEPNTFGWIVEIDPFNPDSVPQKRTALGRFGHEGIIFGKLEEGKPLVFYSGDDSRFEYIYKFVSAAPYFQNTAGGYLLNEGTLYVARFNDDGSGEWLPLDLNNAEFAAKAAAAEVVFADQADVLINTRLAADIAGATKMDRPEWGAVHPDTGEVYFTLTNNTARTEQQTDAANPRAANAAGHIIRWQERNSQEATAFDWDIFLLAGDVGTTTPDSELTLTQDNHLASPDGLWFDKNGLLWIQTDMSGSQQGEGPYGNNQMLVADPVTRQIKRFLVGPTDCEVTGISATPDMKTLFVNIQHPGDRSSPDNFTSNWPDGGNSRPRSATVVVTKNDGGVIGS